MNPFTESNIACAERSVSRAIQLINRGARDFATQAVWEAAIYAELVDAKGRLAAAAQVEELEREVASADTERQATLRVVK